MKKPEPVEDYVPPKLSVKEQATELDRFMGDLRQMKEISQPQDPKKGKK